MISHGAALFIASAVQMKAGIWTLESKTDARWNAQGRTSQLNMLSMPMECYDKLAELREKLGQQPDDLEIILEKDG